MGEMFFVNKRTKHRISLVSSIITSITYYTTFSTILKKVEINTKGRHQQAIKAFSRSPFTKRTDKGVHALSKHMDAENKVLVSAKS